MPIARVVALEGQEAWETTLGWEAWGWRCKGMGIGEETIKTRSSTRGRHLAELCRNIVKHIILLMKMQLPRILDIERHLPRKKKGLSTTREDQIMKLIGQLDPNQGTENPSAAQKRPSWCSPSSLRPSTSCKYTVLKFNNRNIWHHQFIPF